METNQTISINTEKFNVRPEIIEDRFAKGFNAWKKFNNHRRYTYHKIFRRNRTIKETIEFLEHQCFELVVANIIINLYRKPDNTVTTISNDQLNFEISVLDEEIDAPVEITLAEET